MGGGRGTEEVGGSHCCFDNNGMDIQPPFWKNLKETLQGHPNIISHLHKGEFCVPNPGMELSLLLEPPLHATAHLGDFLIKLPRRGEHIREGAGSREGGPHQPGDLPDDLPSSEGARVLLPPLLHLLLLLLQRPQVLRRAHLHTLQPPRIGLHGGVICKDQDLRLHRLQGVREVDQGGEAAVLGWVYPGEEDLEVDGLCEVAGFADVG
uniref:Uncharacterized protein n=1 Tax=Arcella intermedia TaxID=1963864 RepID=A0A6B2LIQ5_9EUKA